MAEHIVKIGGLRVGLRPDEFDALVVRAHGAYQEAQGRQISALSSMRAALTVALKDQPGAVKLIESELPCPSCGEPMSCLLTGPEQMPHIHATYICRNADWRGECQGTGWGAAQTAELEGTER